MKKKYGYILHSSGDVSCYEDSADNQKVGRFAEAESLSEWHDEDLQQCTRELNSILDKYRHIRREELKKLSFLITPKGFFLAWATQVEREAVGEELDDENIVKILKIKSESSISESTEYKEKSSSVLPPRPGWKLKKLKWQGDTPVCSGKGDKCAVTPIVEAVRLTKFHDESLQKCTNELNAILYKYSSKSNNPYKELGIVNTPEGLFLSWIGKATTISAEDDAETLLQALGIE